MPAQKPDPPFLTDLPDFLGLAARVQSVSNLLEQAQTQLQENEQTRIVNGKKPSDTLHGFQGQKGAPSYAERAQQLKDGIAALLEANEDIRDELTAEALKRRRARERHFEQDDGLSRYKAQ